MELNSKHVKLFVFGNFHSENIKIKQNKLIRSRTKREILKFLITTLKSIFFNVRESIHFHPGVFRIIFQKLLFWNW